MIFKPNQAADRSTQWMLVPTILLLITWSPLFWCHAGLTVPGDPPGPCFQQFTFIDDKCTLANGHNGDLTAENGATYLDQVIHVINLESGHCGQGTVRENTDATTGDVWYDLADKSYPDLLGCPGYEGVNYMCPGPCPEPGPNNCFEPAPLVVAGSCYELSSSVLEIEPFECLPAHNDRLTLIVEETGQCFPANCANGILTVENSHDNDGCEALEGYHVTQCVNQECPNNCFEPAPLVVAGSCYELSSSVLEIEPFFECLPAHNDRLTLIVEETGQCFPANCANGILTVKNNHDNNDGCEALEGYHVTQCVNQDCPSAGGGRDLLRVDDAKKNNGHHRYNYYRSLSPEQVDYQNYVNQCGLVEYNVFLLVEHSHFYAIAAPRSRREGHGKDDDESFASSSRQQHCPTLQVQAEYKDLDASATYRKVLSIVPDSIVHRYQHLHYIGTFELDELRRAFESIDPRTKSTSKKEGYDVIVNNCADLLLSLASNLSVKIDAPIISYVTRCLVQQAGQDLADKIRNSVHFQSVLGAVIASSKQHTAGRFLRSSTRGRQRQHQPHHDDDKQIIEALVQIRAGNLVFTG